ncbi:MAG: helix-hairpin-helix domain-containing protein [Verrucomicrobiota bacterium]
MKRRMPAQIEKELRRIPGVGSSLAQDLFDLGITSVRGLVGLDPELLYCQLCQIRGQHQDKCVLYVFRCAVYFASEKNPDPPRLCWWNWKDKLTDA